MNAKGSMALFLLCPNLGWIQGQFNFTANSLRYPGALGAAILAQKYGSKK